MPDIKIYFINLDRSVKRRKFMEGQLIESGVEYIRFPAIDGSRLDPRLLSDITQRLSRKNHHYTLPKAGEIGVYYSHYKVWEQIAIQDEDFALVLEDDALLSAELFHDLPKILQTMKSSEIVDISGITGFYKLEEKLIAEDIELVRFLTPSLRLIGNIIGREAAQRLVESFREYTVPVDNMLQQVYRHRLKIWTSRHPYVQINDTKLGGSTIQIKSENGYEKIRKELLRPFYRLKTHILNSKYLLSRGLSSGREA